MNSVPNASVSQKRRTSAVKLSSVVLQKIVQVQKDKVRWPRSVTPFTIQHNLVLQGREEIVSLPSVEKAPVRFVAKDRREVCEYVAFFVVVEHWDKIQSRMVH